MVLPAARLPDIEFRYQRVDFFDTLSGPAPRALFFSVIPDIFHP